MAYSLPRVLLRAFVEYRWRVLKVGRRTVLALHHHYLPEEAYEVGLLNPDAPLDMVQSAVSRSRMVRIQQRLNPREWESLLSDKGIFYRVCLAAGLPVPALYALYFRDFAGWTHEGKSPHTPDDWVDFFVHHSASEFVVKPTQAAYGAGIMILSRDGEAFIDHRGTSWDAKGLVHHLSNDGEYSSFVLQERLQNHPSIAHLGRGKGVHSFRLVTYIDPAGNARVVAADMKIIVGEGIASNLAHGSHGNVIAEIDREAGFLKEGLVMDVKRGGYRKVSQLPDSGVIIEHFSVPQWDAITSLAVQAAKFFQPVRTVGWDIALCPSGPVIMEGNIWYDPSLTGYVTDYWALALHGS